MSSYPSGAAVLADARLRLDKLPPDQGVVIVEGRDDFLVFCDRVVTIDGLIVSGNKGKLMNALQRVNEADRARIVFIADCDYDVPAGFSPTDPNLILTQNPELETDLVELGLVKPLVLEWVPEARSSDVRANNVAGDVVAKAVALAEHLGRLRQVSKVDGLGLNFDDFALRRYRDKTSGTCDVERLTRALTQRTPDCPLHHSQLMERAAAVPGGLKACHGGDIIEAIATVLHQDYRRTRQELARLDRLLRARLDGERFESWGVAKRLREWQANRCVRILRGSPPPAGASGG